MWYFDSDSVCLLGLVVQLWRARRETVVQVPGMLPGLPGKGMAPMGGMFPPPRPGAPPGPPAPLAPGPPPVAPRQMEVRRGQSVFWRVHAFDGVWGV